MRKNVLAFLVILVILSAILISSCAPSPKPTPTSSPTTPPAEEYKWPDYSTFVVNTIGGNEYGQTMAWGPLLENDTGMKVRVYAAADFTQDQNIKDGKATFRSTSIMSYYPTITGEPIAISRFGGPYNIRYVFYKGITNMQFFVAGDSKIQSWQDVKPGMRVAVNPTELPSYDRINFFLAWCGIDPSEIEYVELNTYDTYARSAIDGRVDVTTWRPDHPWTIEMASAPRGIRALELDPEKYPENYDRAVKAVPYFWLGKTALGPESLVGKYAIAVAAMTTTRAETDADFIYNFTKWHNANEDRWLDKQSQFTQGFVSQTVEASRKDLTPIHEGAVRYLKEIGVWTAEDDKLNQAKSELFDMWVEAYEKAIITADSQGITVTPEHPEWVQLWNSVRDTLPPISWESVNALKGK